MTPLVCHLFNRRFICGRSDFSHKLSKKARVFPVIGLERVSVGAFIITLVPTGNIFIIAAFLLKNSQSQVLHMVSQHGLFK